MSKTFKFSIWLGFILCSCAGVMLMLETITPIREGLWILFLMPSVIVSFGGLYYDMLRGA